MPGEDPKQHTSSTDSAIRRPGGPVGERPTPHTATPPNKPGQYDADDQRKVRSELADVGQADEQTGGDRPRARDGTGGQGPR
jgi:hypothetical protein